MQPYIQKPSNVKSVGIIIFRWFARDIKENVSVFALALKVLFVFGKVKVGIR